MKLTDAVYVVGGGDLGYRISNPYDCNVFVLVGGGESCIIDAGSGMEPETIVDNLIHDGIKPECIKTLFLTHAHADHAGGAAYLRKHLPIRVLAGNRTADIVSNGDEERMSLSDAKRAGIYPEWYRFRKCAIDQVLHIGDQFQVGSLSLRVVSAAGHSADMTGLYCPELKALFAGDAVFEGGRLAVIHTRDFSLEAYRTTIAGFAQLAVEQLFPGHGSALLNNAEHAITLAHERFEQGKAPESIV
ncbi:MBL fold metallo-hydrolase [Paenibacillus sp.]|uniref:MBL fold metallo-hydrolase n=1 Tax=Paenibacillus sp. TaxID=58172 RepID=UPI0028123C3A|nr:MBL fold metallo-hydrolase [Paenibacillus sp.]